MPSGEGDEFGLFSSVSCRFFERWTRLVEGETHKALHSAVSELISSGLASLPSGRSPRV